MLSYNVLIYIRRHISNFISSKYTCSLHRVCGIGLIITIVKTVYYNNKTVSSIKLISN